ncbi:MAG: methyltransferase domain-containing protein [Minisyncoccia bacterium]
MTKQVDKKHYDFSKYSHVGRWGSYYYQLREVLNLKLNSILEVGAGDKVFGSFIKNNTGISYTSLDIAEDLKPDVVAPITKTGLSSNSYDVVCAFEVLEHIPFEEFTIALNELLRVSKNYVVISVPHFGPPVQFLLKIPFLPYFRFSIKIPFAKQHTFNGEHYWEVGKKGFPVSRIIQTIEKCGVLEKHFIPFENQYHHFFIIKKNNG